MDYFLKQDLLAKALIKDTIEYKAIIRAKNNDIKLLKSNESDLKQMSNVNKTLADNYKIIADEEAKKASRRGKILIGSLSLNLVFIGTAYLLIKY